VHRRPALSASEAADISARLPFLRSVVNRLARQATEKDAQWSLVRHEKGWTAASLKKDQVDKANDIDREPGE
jgi:hypothetical protein